MNLHNNIEFGAHLLMQIDRISYVILQYVFLVEILYLEKEERD